MIVAILGSGPAGLAAARACEELGMDFRIYTIPQKSTIAGAQYLHQPIPGISAEKPDGQVTYKFLGTGDEYARKAYKDPMKRTSWDRWTAGPADYWSMRAAYDEMWDRYRPAIVPTDMTPSAAYEISSKAGATFNTIPRPLICGHPNLHKFIAEAHHIGTYSPSDDALVINDETGGSVGIEEGDIVYNGLPFVMWHRASRIDGLVSIESTEPFPGSVMVRKPQYTDCLCQPLIKNIGRFGAWQRDVLVHDAYAEAKAWLTR